MVRNETGTESDMEGSDTTGGQLGHCPQVMGYLMVQKIKTVIMLTFLHSCLAGFEVMGVQNCTAEDTSARAAIHVTGGDRTRTWAKPAAHCPPCHLLSPDQLSEKASNRPRVQVQLPHKSQDWRRLVHGREKCQPCKGSAGRAGKTPPGARSHSPWPRSPRNHMLQRGFL